MHLLWVLLPKGRGFIITISMELISQGRHHPLCSELCLGFRITVECCLYGTGQTCYEGGMHNGFVLSGIHICEHCCPQCCTTLG